MALGMLDLSIVTDRLIKQLKTCTDASPMWTANPSRKPSVTGLAPDAARKKDNVASQISVYLAHVEVDKFHRNTFPAGGSAQTVPEHPLALTLYYVVTAYSPDSHENEQQAMSVALKCFHEHPVVRATVPVQGTNPIQTREEEFTLTIEPQTVDEIGRLWQAISSPLRLSALYRASVIFIEAPEPGVPDVVRHTPAFERPHDVQPFETVPGPAVSSAMADATGFVAITIGLAGFTAGASAVRLRSLPLFETTTAGVPLVARHFRVVAADTLHLRVPLFTPRGQYLLRVLPAATSRRTLEIDVIVPETVVTVAAGAAGLATIAIDDAQFAAGAVTVTFEAVPLVETTTRPPAAGRFRVVDPATIELKVPTPTPAGRYLLRVLPAAGKPTMEIRLDVP